MNKQTLKKLILEAYEEVLVEMNQDEVEDGTYAGRPVKVHMHGEVTKWYVEFPNGKKVPYSETLANIKHPSKPSHFNEAEEPQPEEQGDPKAPEETILEDATDQILSKFPTLRHTIQKLQTEDFKEFVDSIDWISPRPSSFRVNLKNGQDYILKWMGKGFEAQILGKRYYLSNIAEYQQALDKLALLYKEAPMDQPEEEGEGVPDDFGSADTGGGDFPGGEEGGGAPPEPEGGEDLGGEPVDFEAGEEPA